MDGQSKAIALAVLLTSAISSQTVLADGSVIFRDAFEQGQFFLASNGVTVMCPDAEVGATGVVRGITYTKRTRDQINSGNAATTCTSGIIDFEELFQGESEFNEDISSWDTSSVETMAFMFNGAALFNQDIGYWNTQSVTSMRQMFSFATAFNQDIGRWNISAVVIPPFLVGRTSRA